MPEATQPQTRQRRSSSGVEAVLGHIRRAVTPTAAVTVDVEVDFSLAAPPPRRRELAANPKGTGGGGAHGGEFGVRVGHLHKARAPNERWLKRWFVLQGNVIAYFASADDRQPLGAFVLHSNCVVTARPGELNGRKHCFDVMTPERTFHLSADTAEDANAWCDVLASVAFDRFRQAVYSLASLHRAVSEARTHAESSEMAKEMAVADASRESAARLDLEERIRKLQLLCASQQREVQKMRSTASASAPAPVPAPSEQPFLNLSDFASNVDAGELARLKRERDAARRELEAVHAELADLRKMPSSPPPATPSAGPVGTPGRDAPRDAGRARAGSNSDAAARERARIEARMRDESAEWLAVVQELRDCIDVTRLPTDKRVKWLESVQPRLQAAEEKARARVAGQLASPMDAKRRSSFHSSE